MERHYPASLGAMGSLGIKAFSRFYGGLFAGGTP